MRIARSSACLLCYSTLGDTTQQTASLDSPYLRCPQLTSTAFADFLKEHDIQHLFCEIVYSGQD